MQVNGPLKYIMYIIIFNLILHSAAFVPAGLVGINTTCNRDLAFCGQLDEIPADFQDININNPVTTGFKLTSISKKLLTADFGIFAYAATSDFALVTHQIFQLLRIISLIGIVVLGAWALYSRGR